MHKDVVDYINDILEHKILSSIYFYKAVERFIKFYDNQDDYDIWFDVEAAHKVFEFASHFRHYKGHFAGKPFILEPWQKFVIYDTYAWKFNDSNIRYKNKAYLQVARKNGKTTLGAILSLFGLFEEQGAEVILAATTKEQSSILLRDAKNFASNAPHVAEHLAIMKYIIEDRLSSGFLKNISSDSSVQDGLSPSTVFIDEYHGFKNDDLLEVLESGMGSRIQPILWIITTAGFILEGPCYHTNKLARKILDGVEENNRANYYLFELDEDDDLSNTDLYVKANPNINVSVTKEYLLEQYQKTVLEPSKINNFLTKHCNKFVAGSYQFLRSADWEQCAQDYTEDDLLGQECFGGLDLSIKNDLSAFVLLFPQEGGTYRTLNYNFSHKGKLRQDDHSGFNYKYYEQQNWIYLNPGDVVDYDQIEYKILELAQKFDIKSIAYDRFMSFQIVPRLEDKDLTLSAFGQGYVSMCAPTKEVQNLVAQKKLHHNNNELFSKQMYLIDIETDPAGNMKISKKSKAAKVDSAVALVMAIGEHMDHIRQNRESVYSGRDISFL